METILIVEDELNIRENLAELLESEGFNILEAEDGKEGYETASKKLPDLIISDIRMPNMDGFEMLQKLQNDSDTANIPLLFLSAKVEFSDIREGMLYGADDYITKPFKAQDVLKAVEVRLRKKRNHDNLLEKLRNSFIKNVPHELRTPLISIIGFSEIIENDLESLTETQLKEMAVRINKSGKRLHRRIEKMIQFGYLLAQEEIKDDSIKFEIDTEFNALLLEKIAKDYGREKDVKSLFENGTLKIESSNFELLLNELVENSIKFSEPGSIVHVVGKKNSKDYQITVKDKGKGINIKSFEEVDLFKKIDEDYMNREGLGIGLALAKRIVEISRGKIKIDSKVDSYTKIEINLPLAE
jgi:DNA-binding response OmpR family regulator